MCIRDSPSTLSIGQGGQGTTGITITPSNGFSGTVTFSALGLAMAGALRAEVTLASANGLYLLFLLLGGGILPLSHLPPTLAAIAEILPAAALTQALQATMSGQAPFPLNSLIILVIWTIAILLVAMKTFKWE